MIAGVKVENGSEGSSPGCGSKVDDATEKRAGCDDNAAATQRAAIGKLQAGNLSAARRNTERFGFDQREVVGMHKRAPHGCGVELAVRLSAGALNCGPLSSIEDAELYSCGVGDTGHEAVEGVDFSDKVSLP